MKTKNKMFLLLGLVILALVSSVTLIYRVAQNNALSSKLKTYEIDNNIRLSIPKFTNVVSQDNCNNPKYSDQTCYDFHYAKGYIRIIKEFCPADCIYRETIGLLYDEDINNSKLILLGNQKFYRFGYQTNTIEREDGGIVYGIVKEITDDNQIDPAATKYTPFIIINEYAYSMMYILPEDLEDSQVKQVLKELDELTQTIDFQ